MVLTHSSDQKSLINLLNSNRFVTANYIYKSKCIESIRNVIVEKLAAGKKILILDSDGRFTAEIKTELQELELDKLILDLIQKKQIIHADELRSDLLVQNCNAETVDVAYVQLTKNKNERKKQDFLKACEKLNKQLFDKGNWQSLVDYKSLLDRSLWNSLIGNQPDVRHFEWTMEEFFQLEKELGYKAYNYRNHFKELNTIDPFTNNLYASVESEADHDQWITKIQEQHIKIKQIRAEVAELYEREQSLKQAEYSFEFTELRSTLEQMIDLSELKSYLNGKKEKEPKTSFLAFDKNPVDSLIEKTELQEKALKEEASGYPILSNLVKDISSNDADALNELLLLVDDQHEDILQNNPQDLVAFPVDEYLLKIEEVINDIKSWDIFQELEEIKSTDLKETLIKIDHLIAKITTALNLLTYNEDFVKWQHSKSKDSEQLATILNVLSTFDTDEWKDLFETWYLLHIIDNNYHPLLPDSGTLENLFIGLEKERDLTVNFIKYYWKKQILFADKTFSNELLELKRFQRSSTKRLNADIAYESWGKLISNYFPITISNNQLVANNPAIFEQWDFVLSIDSLIHWEYANSISTDTMHLSLLSTAQAMMVDKIDIQLSEKGYTCNHVFDPKMIETNKYLIESICQCCLPESVFQNDNTLILSFLSQPKNLYVHRLVKSKGFRKIDLGENPVEELKDIIIPGLQNVHIMVQDGVLDFTAEIDIISQVQLISNIANKGYKVHHLWSKDYYFSGKELLQSLLSPFKNVDKPTESKAINTLSAVPKA